MGVVPHSGSVCSTVTLSVLTLTDTVKPWNPYLVLTAGVHRTMSRLSYIGKTMGLFPRTAWSGVCATRDKRSSARGGRWKFCWLGRAAGG